MTIKSPKDRILVFYTDNSPNISYNDFVELLNYPNEFEMIKCNTGKNGLDFQLVTYLGFLLKSAPKTDYIIVSKDTGYDVVSKFWKNMSDEFSVKRLNVTETIKAHNKELSQKEVLRGSASDEQAVCDELVVSIDQVVCDEPVVSNDQAVCDEPAVSEDASDSIDLPTSVNSVAHFEEMAAKKGTTQFMVANMIIPAIPSHSECSPENMMAIHDLLVDAVRDKVSNKTSVLSYLNDNMNEEDAQALYDAASPHISTFTRKVKKFM